MGHVLVIHHAEELTRVALIEHGVVTEFHHERASERSLVGNIYKGRVVRVLPGMQSAFVDIGLERAAFLYVGDIGRSIRELEALDDDDESATGESAGGLVARLGSDGGAAPPEHPAQQRSLPIEDLLRQGQEVLVQIAKDPLGTKGARVTTNISLPGRNVVFLPSVEHIGISRRIGDEAERARLRAAAERIRPPGAGLIVRTAGEGKSEEELREDVDFLTRLWKDIPERAETTAAPACLHQDLDLVLRATRDLLTSDFERLYIDDEGAYRRLLAFVERFMPRLRGLIEHYAGREPIFDHFGVELEIGRALDRKVWLKSGGYIVIDQAEALTAVDVNTGRYVGKTNLEETILKINLEAVREIAYQLRLRNIGGLIIIDFIDMAAETSRERVHEALVTALRGDRARSNVLPMSQLGLVEMTRKRVRESLRDTLSVPCFYCDGRGYLKSPQVVCREILSLVATEIRQPLVRNVYVTAHPRIIELLCEEHREAIERLELESQHNIILRSRSTLHFEQYEIVNRT